MDRRKFERLTLEDLSAKLFKVEGNTEIEYFPINVSKTGMSIFTTCYLAKGTVLELVLSVEPVRLIVTWCKAKEDDLAVFRVGLELVAKDLELDDLIKKELTF